MELSHESAEKKVTKKDLVKVWWRSLFIMSTINYERFQSMGFTYAILPVLRRLYKTKEEMSDALKRHMCMFNTNPYFSNPILGVTAALEEANANGHDMTETINGVKVALMGPFAGIGDGLFDGTIRAILEAIGAGLALQGSILGPIFFLVTWNAIQLSFRYWGTFYGYKTGAGIVKDIKKESNALNKITKAAGVIGLVVLGALVANWITMYTPIKIAVGQDPKNAIELQQVLDNILPGIMPLALTMLVAWLLKKNVKINYILLGIFIFAFVATFTGFLA
jgi:mannose/fructose/sorbose-specific phosphotransferase system IID component